MRARPLLFILVTLVAACAASGPAYSPASEREINLLRGRTLRLMEKAEQPFSDHAAAVEKLNGQLTQARARAALRDMNTVSVSLWDTLLDPEGYLVAGYLARWQADTTLSPGFIAQAMGVVEEAFGVLIKHEVAKLGGPR